MKTDNVDRLPRYDQEDVEIGVKTTQTNKFCDTIIPAN